MSLIEEWRQQVYNIATNKKQMEKFWDNYFKKEKVIYKDLLKDPSKEVKGKVKDLAEKYEMTIHEMAGFLDGINESLLKANSIDDITEDTDVSLKFDNEKLYKNMVEAKADWLYNLPEWDKIFSKEQRDEMYKEQKKAHTVVNPKKIGRNDSCPCNSGKKYKFCCGKNK